MSSLEWLRHERRPKENKVTDKRLFVNKGDLINEYCETEELARRSA